MIPFQIDQLFIQIFSCFHAFEFAAFRDAEKKLHICQHVGEDLNLLLVNTFNERK